MSFKARGAIQRIAVAQGDHHCVKIKRQECPSGRRLIGMRSYLGCRDLSVEEIFTRDFVPVVLAALVGICKYLVTRY